MCRVSTLLAFTRTAVMIFLLAACCSWVFSQSARASAEAELQTAIDLTRRGAFSDAIPHFLAADGHVSDEHALRFNLALCYVGTAEFENAIRLLESLKSSGYNNENVENLLAQSYVGAGKSDQALEALHRAASFSPQNEKLYAFVADACADRQDYDLGLHVVDFGLQNLSKSARLHYQRGYFLVMLNQWDAARPEFDLAASLAPHSEIAYLAQAQKFKFAGDVENEIRVVRQAILDGHANYLVLTILGEGLIAAGATPGQPEFSEAKSVLSNAVEVRPQFAGAQLSLGSLLLMENNYPQAIRRLELAKSLAPGNPTVYSRLALAYRKSGDKPAADAALAQLAKLNAQQVDQIRSAPGDRKPIMTGGEPSVTNP